jgi:hypothetical protein
LSDNVGGIQGFSSQPGGDRTDVVSDHPEIRKQVAPRASGRQIRVSYAVLEM